MMPHHVGDGCRLSIQPSGRVIEATLRLHPDGHYSSDHSWHESQDSVRETKRHNHEKTGGVPRVVL